MLKRLIAAAFTLSALTLTSQAQDANARAVEIRLLCFAHAGDLDEIVAIGESPEETLKCELPLRGPSDVFKWKALGNSIKFASSVGGPVVANAAIPASLNRALLVFIPAGEKRYNVLVIDDSRKGFPPGGMLAYNLSAAGVRFVAGEHKIEMPPGKSAVIPRPKEIDDFNMAGVKFMFEMNDVWRVAVQTKMQFTSNARYLALCYFDPQTKRPRVKTYQDFPPPEIPAAQAGQ